MSGFSFLLPAGLFALIALPLVYLFHMRSPTPRRLTVPTLRFWQAAAPKPTDEPRFRRPPLSRSLLLHLAIALAMALALARPAADVLAGALGSSGAPAHLVIVLDGSTSMLATDTQSGDTRFAEAKRAAVAALGGLRSGDAATLLLLGGETSSRSAGNPGEFKSLATYVNALDAPGGKADLTGALLLAADLRVPGMQNRVLLLSDGALTVDQTAVAALGAPIETQWFGSQSSWNAAIVDATVRNDPAQPSSQQMTARLLNAGDQERQLPVEYDADGIRVSGQTVDVPAGGDVDLTFTLPSKTKIASIHVDADDALALDNTAVAPAAAAGASGLSVLIFSDHPDALSRAFGALPGSRIDTETTDSAKNGMGTSGYDIVVYDEVAPSTAPVSPAFYVAPSDSSTFRSPAMLSSSTITSSDASDPLMTGVDLTGVTFGTTPQYQLPTGFSAVVSAADGPLLARGTLANGQPAVLLAPPIEGGNLADRIAFPILIANIAQLLAPAPAQSTFELGESVSVAPHAGTALLRITDPSSSESQVEVTDAAVSTGVPVVLPNIVEPGAYGVQEIDADGGQVSTRVFAVNAGDQVESDLRANPNLQAQLDQAASTDATVSKHASLNDLWPLLVLLALALAVIEAVSATWRGAPARTAS